jgi:hypothetical protein
LPWVAGASSQTPTSPNRKPHPHPVAQKRPKWSRFCFWLPAVPWSLSPSLSCPPPPVPDGGSAATRTRTRADIIRCKRRDQTAKAHSSRSPSDPFIPLGFLLLRPLRSPSDHPCEAVTQPGAGGLSCTTGHAASRARVLLFRGFRSGDCYSVRLTPSVPRRGEGSEMGYIGHHGVATLRRYKYSGVDHSLVAKYILQPFWSRFVNIFPLWFP